MIFYLLCFGGWLCSRKKKFSVVFPTFCLKIWGTFCMDTLYKYHSKGVALWWTLLMSIIFIEFCSKVHVLLWALKQKIKDTEIQNSIYFQYRQGFDIQLNIKLSNNAKNVKCKSIYRNQCFDIITVQNHFAIMLYKVITITSYESKFTAKRILYQRMKCFLNYRQKDWCRQFTNL